MKRWSGDGRGGDERTMGQGRRDDGRGGEEAERGGGDGVSSRPTVKIHCTRIMFITPESCCADDYALEVTVRRSSLKTPLGS